MTTGCEPTLTDESLVADIELLGSVILAVNLLPGPLTESEVDEALGVPHPQKRANKVLVQSSDEAAPEGNPHPPTGRPDQVRVTCS